MERELIHKMFSRSVSNYGVFYVAYIGDGDAKVHKYLLENSPYQQANIHIRKLEGTNHFAKRVLHRIMKVRQDNKKTILVDGKRFFGKNRFTQACAIKFKIYFAKAIRETKTDINRLYERTWAIFKHHYSSNEEPMHEWCEVSWCKFLRAKPDGHAFDHDSKASIPRACLDLIQPVFEELCSYESLSRVIGGVSQNANECFHSVVWKMAPKHRFCLSIVLRMALGLSTITFNDGYKSLCQLFINLFSNVGYFTSICFDKIDSMRKSTTEKRTQGHIKRLGTKTTNNVDVSLYESGDEFDNLKHGDCSANITGHINILEQLESDENLSVNSDYEAGGDA